MSLGFSNEKLGNIQAFVKHYVDDGKLPGYLCLVSRYGEEAHFLAYGKRDVERGTAITRDTVFRIYSMSKPITSRADDVVRTWCVPTGRSGCEVHPAVA